MNHLHPRLHGNRYFLLSLQVTIVLLFLQVSKSWGQTNFYSNATGNVNVLTTWGTATDGSGAHPANFTTDGQVFNIRNNPSPTIVSNWAVSGVNSKIIVGDG